MQRITMPYKCLSTQRSEKAVYILEHIHVVSNEYAIDYISDSPQATRRLVKNSTARHQPIFSHHVHTRI